MGRKTDVKHIGKWKQTKTKTKGQQWIIKDVWLIWDWTTMALVLKDNEKDIRKELKLEEGKEADQDSKRLKTCSERWSFDQMLRGREDRHRKFQSHDLDMFKEVKTKVKKVEFANNEL